MRDIVPSSLINLAMARFEGFLLDQTTFAIVLKRDLSADKENNQRLGGLIFDILFPALLFGFQREELALELVYVCRNPGETFW